MAQIYGVPDEFMPIVYEAIAQRPFQREINTALAFSFYGPGLDGPREIFDQIASLLDCHRHDLELQGKLEDLEEFRYQKRLKSHSDGSLPKLDEKQSIECIMRDFGQYILYLKSQKGPKAKTIKIILNEIMQRIQMLSNDTTNQKKLIYGFFSCLDSTRTLLHCSTVKYVKDCNYGDLINLERLLYAFLEIFVFNKRIGLYPSEKYIIELHDPFFMRFVSHENGQRVTRPSDLLYALYLEASGYTIKKIAHDSDHAAVNDNFWHLVKPEQPKKEQEILIHLMRTGFFIDNEHLKNILCLYDSEGSLKKMENMADNGVVVHLASRPSKDFFIEKHNHYVVTHGIDLFHYFHIGLSSLLLTHEDGNLYCTQNILCSWLDRYALSPQRYKKLAVLCVKKDYGRALAILFNRYHVDPDQRDPDSNKTLIVIAIELGHTHSVRVLIHNHVNINILNQTAEPLFFLAARLKHIAIMRLLIDKSDITLKNADGQNLLMVLSKEGYVEEVRALTAYPMPLEARDPYGKTALMLAAQNGHLEIIRLLKAVGADLEAKQEPLKWDCDADRLQMFQDSSTVLYDSYQMREAVLHHSKTALMLAAYKGDHKTVATLIQEGALLETKDKYNRTALILAAHQGHQKVVEILVQEGAFVNLEEIRNAKKDVPCQNGAGNMLVFAIWKERVASINAFLEHHVRKKRLEQDRVDSSLPELSVLIGARVRLFSEQNSDAEKEQKNKKARKL